MKSSIRKDEKSQSPQAAEWMAFAIALTIMLTLVGLILYIWITDTGEPPTITVNLQPVRTANQQFYVPFEISNIGGKTAESVQVIGELKIGDQVQEEGEQQIDFLAAGEQEEGAFVFSRDPREGDVSVRVASYKIP